MSEYDQFFTNQLGSSPHFGDLYKTNRYYQRGRGLGDALSGIIRFLTPLFLKGTKAVGAEALRSGSEILSNLGSKPLNELLKDQKDKTITNLTEKAMNKLKRVQTGKGIKRRRTTSSKVIRELSALTKTRKKCKKTTKVKKRKSVVKKSASTDSKLAFLRQYIK